MHDPLNDEPLAREMDGIELPEIEYELTPEAKAHIDLVIAECEKIELEMN